MNVGLEARPVENHGSGAHFVVYPVFVFASDSAVGTLLD